MLKIAYFSPLTPQHSGIADYNEELLPYLAEEAEIDLFVDGFVPTNKNITSRFQILDYKSSPQVLDQLSKYDAVLYHIGNDHRYHTGIYRTAIKHPGIIVLHDFALQHFFCGLAQAEEDGVGIYLDELEASAGFSTRQTAEKNFKCGELPPQAADPIKYPLNFRLATQSEAIFVHSEWSRARLVKIAPVTPVYRVPFAVSNRREQPAPDLSGQFTERSKKQIRIASFGLVTPDKGVERALRGLAKLRTRFNFQYTLVGETNPHFDVRAIIRELDLQDRVEITEHIPIEEFVRRISETDIAINLREQTVGETSASLCRIMAAGVAAIVSDLGWFSELPETSVVKIDMENCADELLEAYLARLIEDERLRTQIGENAQKYMFKNHRIENSAAQYLEFIRGTIAARPRRHFIGNVAAQLAQLDIRDQTAPNFMQKVAREIARLAPNMPILTSNENNKALSVITDENKSGAIANQTIPLSIDLKNEEQSFKFAPTAEHKHGRLLPLEDLDYERGALEYVRQINDEHRYYLHTKPFYNLAGKPAKPFINLAGKPPKYEGDGMDIETHRHFCDFANMAVELALPAGSKILDVGCGSGWLAEYFARLGYDVTGVDISPELVEMSRARIKSISYDADHETKLRCRFKTLNVERGALDEQFDAVICYDSLHHFTDEHAALRNIARMTKSSGRLFILEGDKPPDNSTPAFELQAVMEKFATLESPFHPDYLRSLLNEYGFAILGDYVSINGLFPRESVDLNDRLKIRIDPVNYLLCKKVSVDSAASSVPDSRNPNLLAAHLELLPNAEIKTANGEFVSWQSSIKANSTLYVPLKIENTGDTLWLAGREAERGVVMIGIKIYDANENLISETHSSLPLSQAVAPLEIKAVVIKYRAPQIDGNYTLKIDLVDQQICWFEERGTSPLILEFKVD